MLSVAADSSRISDGSAMGFMWLSILMVVVMVALYFAPTIIAIIRKHHNVMPVALVNTLLGWTVVGWVVALVWSFSSPPSSPRIEVNLSGDARPSAGRVCLKCGTVLVVSDKFCGHCGQVVPV